MTTANRGSREPAEALGTRSFRSNCVQLGVLGSVLIRRSSSIKFLPFLPPPSSPLLSYSHCFSNFISWFFLYSQPYLNSGEQSFRYLGPAPVHGPAFRWARPLCGPSFPPTPSARAPVPRHCLGKIVGRHFLHEDFLGEGKHVRIAFRTIGKRCAHVLSGLILCGTTVGCFVREI